MSHSKEPWTIAGTKKQVHDASGRNIEYDCADGFEMRDIERIVACVNACAGIPTEALVAGQVAIIPKAVSYIAVPPDWDSLSYNE